MTEFNRIGQTFKKLRAEKGWSQLKVCIESELSLETIRLLEAGRRSSYRIKTIKKVCEAFEMTLADFFKLARF